jgi:ferric-dicitrate binding protein FerR (iron transport regulator)
MDPQASYNEEQWELMLSALQGELTAEERIRLDHWLAASPVNRRCFEQLESAWREGLADYLLYTGADENMAWDALQRKLGEHRAEAGAPRPAARMPGIEPWLAVAALVVLLAGAGWYFFKDRYSGAEYLTGVGETKQVSLPDGTTVELDGATRLEIPAGYDRGTRNLRLVSGKASFDVVHNPARPFRVDAGAVRVEDVGTKFTLENSADTVRLSVAEGRVAFWQTKTGEKRELGAGESLSVYSGMDSMRFNNTPVAEILAALERHSGRKIELSDNTFAGRKLTINLDGESLENSLRIICASLDLEYTLKAGVYVLDKKK